MRTEQVYPDIYEHDDLTFRCWDMNDAEALSSASNDSYRALEGWIPWATPVMPIGMAEDLCIRFEDEFRGGRDFSFGVWEDRRLIGGAAYHPTGERSADVEVWVRTTLMDKGFGTRILEGVLDWAYKEWDFDTVTFKCPIDAPAARRIAEKIGLDVTETVPGGFVGPDGRRHDADVFVTEKRAWLAAV